MEYRWTVLTVTTVGVLMAGINSRIIIIGLPQVASSLHADAEEAIWFTQAYVLGSTVTLLFIGRLSDIFGRVKIYNLGFAIFTIGSFLTSLSSSPLQVISFRLVQGIGAAALFSNSAAIITDATPLDELGFALGINQVAFRVGAISGLTISGLILSSYQLDWRALFLINVPIGVFGTIWAHTRLKEVSRLERQYQMDWLGSFIFTISISSLILALTIAAYGSHLYKDALILILLSFFACILFYFRERRFSSPLLDLSLLRIREFIGGILAQLINAIAWGAALLLVSLYLQLVKGMSPLQAGVAILPFDIAFLIAGPLCGKLSDKFGHLPFTTSGLVIISISLYLLSTADQFTSYALIALYLILFGIGMGLFSSPNMSSIMGSVPPQRRGVASGLRATFFNIGFTLSLNLAVLIMSFFVPYNLITDVISSQGRSNLGINEREEFSTGLQHVYLWLSLINAIAIIPSLMRKRGS